MNFTEPSCSYASCNTISTTTLSGNLEGMVNRQRFDPRKKEHLESVKKFIETGNWGSVQFFCEPPFTDVPMMVLTHYAAFKLKADHKARNKFIHNAKTGN